MKKARLMMSFILAVIMILAYLLPCQQQRTLQNRVVMVQQTRLLTTPDGQTVYIGLETKHQKLLRFKAGDVARIVLIMLSTAMVIIIREAVQYFIAQVKRVQEMLLLLVIPVMATGIGLQF